MGTLPCRISCSLISDQEWLAQKFEEKCVEVQSLYQVPAAQLRILRPSLRVWGLKELQRSADAIGPSTR